MFSPLYQLEEVTAVSSSTRRSRKQLMDDVTKTGGYWEQKEDAIDHNVWINGFGIGFRPVVRQTIERMNRSLQGLNLHILNWTSPKSVTEYFWYELRGTNLPSRLKCLIIEGENNYTERNLTARDFYGALGVHKFSKNLEATSQR